MTLPSLVIGGAPKCGTSSLFRWLADHPQVCTSRAKETFYLMDREHALARPGQSFHDGGIRGYERFFEHCGEAPVVLEGTTHYLYQQTACEVLASLPTRPRLVFSLREPAGRVYSSFNYTKNNLANLDAGVTFSQFIAMSGGGHLNEAPPRLDPRARFLRDEVQQGEYVDHLERWVTALGRERIRLLLFERLRENPRDAVVELSTWLGIDATWYDHYDFSTANPTIHIRRRGLHRLARRVAPLVPTGRIKQVVKRLYMAAQRQPPSGMSEEDRQMLDALRVHYRPYNERLAERFGLDLSCWA